MRALALLTVPVLLLTACAPKVSVQMLRPADVALPATIHTLAVVDRSAPTGAGQQILGTLEAAITGEGILEDRDGAREAMGGLTQVLRDSPRFEVVIISADNQAVESSIWDRELGWNAARRLARNVNADAIVALEAFDSDSFVDHRVETQTTNGTTTQKHVASRETRVLAAWRVYDVSEERVLDDVRDHAYTNTWEEEGASRREATDKLPSRAFTVLDLGRDAGVGYGMRIAPTYVWQRRAYYGGGSPRLKEAKNYVKAQDWEGAVALWTLAAKAADPKIRGKAEFNMALALEVGGDLEGALEWAKKAAVSLANGRARKYVSTLQFRIREAERVAEQMRAAEAAPPARGTQRPVEGGELAVPADEPAPQDRGMSRPR
ncbi:MAG: hypothetical protein JXX28_04725 [Deltaproteobacteria bacterium]|nr:hypothetical protein [Deltaproteobacteria bacterium]